LSIAKAIIPKNNQDEIELNDIIIDCIQDIKGKNIVKLDLTEIEEASADFFIICEGDSTTQVKAISNNIHKRIKDEFGILPNHVEKRAFYEIEELWSDAKHTEYEDL